jgi:oligopeptide/dipeptide ABC transporter ATP-binding protein
MGKLIEDPGILLSVENLKKYFPVQKGIFRKVIGHVKAVDDVNLFIREGETLGLVGESGCGKTTTGRCIPRLLEPTSGRICYRKEGEVVDIARLEKEELKEIRREIQIVFQDPVSSLDPRMMIKDIIAEPLLANRIGSKDERLDRVKKLLDTVNISTEYMNRYPHEFSGGQRQRIGIARSLVLSPRLVICDEPVSALDVSIQAQVINLLSDLQDELKLTYLFIAHDLSVVEHISDRVAVMYLGKVVELGPTERLYQQPRHPYTEALLKSIPMADPLAKQKKTPLEGDVPDPSHPPEGCYFHTRCPYVKALCSEKTPSLMEARSEEDHFDACLRSDELDLKGFDEIRKSRREPFP